MHSERKQKSPESNGLLLDVPSGEQHVFIRHPLDTSAVLVLLGKDKDMLGLFPQELSFNSGEKMKIHCIAPAWHTK